MTRPESRVLNGHLKTCAECQQTERDYRDQRQLLRGLSKPAPPRDMWARTSTALDRELGRYPHRYPNVGRRLFGGRADGRRSGGAPNAITTVVTALAVVTVLGVMQLAPLRPPAQTPESNNNGNATAALLPTPFAVDPQPIAILAGNESDYSIWETSINQVCPTNSLDCFDDSDIVRHQVVLPSQFRPQNVALSPNGEQLAVVGTESNRDVIAVVMLVGSGGSVNPQTPPRTDPPATEPPANTREPATAKPATPDVTVPPVETVTPDSSASPSTEPEPTDQASEPVQTGTDEPVATVSTDEPPATSVPPTDEPTPGATPTQKPVATSGGPASIPTGVAPETVMPTRVPKSPPPSAVPGLTVLSILEDVHSAGAPPAWSRDGSALAFSAMPADGSHGPDVYIWEPGDAHARAITDDHTSFFASWSGTRRVVISRLAESDDRSSPLQIATVVTDLETGEERAVEGPQMWLPSVDNQRDQAIVWRGEIERDELLPVLRSGALYLADWASLDPYSDTSVPGIAAADVLTAVEPDRDAGSSPVRDWHARWSSDGSVFGIWEADAPGSSWGSLTLLTIDPDDGLADEPLFDLNLAKRGFTLGSDRVAWIAPGNENTEGELRIRTWGADGEGGLSIQPPSEGELVPAF